MTFAYIAMFTWRRRLPFLSLHTTTLLNMAETVSSKHGLGAQMAEVILPIPRILPYISNAFSASKYAFGLISDHFAF